MKPNRATIQRPKQQTPQDIIQDLLQAIRSGFYEDAKKWFQDQNFLLRRVVLWPATWFNQRGVSLPPERYKQILLEIFQGIKRHGQTETVKYWPGYLASCVQKHFAIHGEEYYEEAKALRAKCDNALLMAAQSRQAAPVAAPDPVRQLADLRAAIAPKKKRVKAVAKQPELFKL